MVCSHSGGGGAGASQAAPTDPVFTYGTIFSDRSRSAIVPFPIGNALTTRRCAKGPDAATSARFSGGGRPAIAGPPRWQARVNVPNSRGRRGSRDEGRDGG